MSELIGITEGAKESGSGTERPLTDDERALIQRLLSDPFSFPIQFKTWLVSFLEGSDLTLPRSSVQGLTSLLGGAGGGGVGIFGLLPAGMIIPYGAPTEPDGAKFCNGQALNRITFQRLYTAIGTQFGVGDGSTTFNVPDMRRRVPWGSGTGVGIGAHDGQAEGGRTLDHHHYVPPQNSIGVAVGGSVTGGGGHEHNYTQRTTGSFTEGTAGTTLFDARNVSTTTVGTSGGGGHSHGWSGGGAVDVPGQNTQGGGLLDRPAFLVVGWIINT